MDRGFESQLWYKVARLKPRLRGHTRIFSHRYRDKPWYVLTDSSSGRTHRFDVNSHAFIAMLDGQTKVEDILEVLEQELGDRCPSQHDLVNLLSQLYAADLLSVDLPGDTGELLQRLHKREAGKWKQRFSNPFAMRFPLFDPDKLLDGLYAFLRPCLSGWLFALWVVLVGVAVLQAGVNWDALSNNVAAQVLTPLNLFLLWVFYPVVKLIHELAHGIAVKHGGGEVHEFGLMFLVFMPMPYVDASAAAAFPSKRQRMMVGAAGVFAELFIAACALFIWLAVEPGAVRSLAYSLMLVAGVSTVFFNANPLLRFDGYYVLADALEIPNLAQRAKQFAAYCLQRNVFKVSSVRTPVADRTEGAWLLAYWALSGLYRLLILWAIVLFVSSKFFVLGVLLAIWAVISQLLLPIIGQLKFLLASPVLHARRRRAISLTGGTLATALLIAILVPLPNATYTQGVVWAPHTSELRVGTGGIVSELYVPGDSRVEAGVALLQLSAPELITRVAELEADRQEIRAMIDAARVSDPIQLENLREQLALADADLNIVRGRLEQQTLKSSQAGIFLVSRPQDLVGQYLEQGDLIGFVADLDHAVIRTVVSQADIGLLREGFETVEVRLADRPEKTLSAAVTQEVPKASMSLPHRALGTSGGGSIPVDPADPDARRTLQEVFHVELLVDEPISRLGGRAYVRFDHGRTPLVAQWFRSLRQLFLRQFNV